jgi:hypothetical protein
LSKIFRLAAKVENCCKLFSYILYFARSGAFFCVINEKREKRNKSGRALSAEMKGNIIDEIKRSW